MNDDHDHPSKQEEDDQDEAWKKYQLAVINYRKNQLSYQPGYFAKNYEQQFYDQCLHCPMPSKVLKSMPVLSLPLRVNIIRNEYLGCSDALNIQSVKDMICTINETYWSQAGISWNLVNVIDRSFDQFEEESDDGNDGTNNGRHYCFTKEQQQNTVNLISTFLTRGSDGRMQNRDKRVDIFLNTILPLFKYEQDVNTFDIWIFDYIGKASQGCCICRKTHTIILGERSDKGYDKKTYRPHNCLSKTMAHELGHALGLGHPRGRVFNDGQSQIIHTDKKNLMEGGIDRNGGGGHYLEQWQITLTRFFAEKFLHNQQEKRKGRRMKIEERMNHKRIID